MRFVLPKRPTKQKGAEKERREHVLFVTYSNIAPGCPKKKRQRQRERVHVQKEKKGTKEELILFVSRQGPREIGVAKKEANKGADKKKSTCYSSHTTLPRGCPAREKSYTCFPEHGICRTKCSSAKT